MEPIDSDVPAKGERVWGSLAAVAILAAAGLGGCATPRNEAATSLAQQGVAATTGLSADVGDLAHRLGRASDMDVLTTARTRLLQCQTRPEACVQPRDSDHRTIYLGLNPDGSMSRLRMQLAAAVLQRQRAIDALTGAYAAFEAEAQYDAANDLSGAVGDAVDSVNGFVGSVRGLPGGAGLASAPESVAVAAGMAARFHARRAQEARLQSANAQLALAVRALRDALAVEAAAFDTLAGYVAGKEQAVRELLVANGLVSPSESLRPLADALGMPLVDNSDEIIEADPVLRGALARMVQDQSAEAARQRQARYRAALRALDGLIQAHQAFATAQPSDNEVLRGALGELEALQALMSAGAGSGGD